MKTRCTQTLGDFLSDREIVRVWWTSVGCPGGSELALNLEDEGEDYCDSQSLLDFVPADCEDLEGTVTQDSAGEWRWEVDSLQDSEATDSLGNTLLNLVVWGE